MDLFKIQVNLTLNFLLKKLQNSITEKHPEAKKSVLQHEIDIDFSEETQREGDKSNEERIGPVAAELTHQMRWVQEFKQVSLVGYGWNYCQNLETTPRYSKMTIPMARFEDSKTTLHDSIRLRKHIFVTSWKDFIKIDLFGDRTILKKDLSFINEKNHKELVKTKLEQTHKDLNKQLSTLGLDSDQEGDGTMSAVFAL